MKKLIIIPSLLIMILLGSGCMSDAPTGNVGHFSKSIEYHNTASKILNNSNDTNMAEDVEKIVDLYRSALDEANQVDINQLNADYANFGDHYKNEFIKGTDSVITGYDQGDDQQFMNGQYLLDDWGNWYSENFNQIRKL